VARRYVFADEAGDLEFARKPNVSKYFIVCVVRTDSCQIGNDLLDLRRQLIWDKLPVKDHFHCSHDKQVVRDRVFDLIRKMDIRVYAQVMEKSKAMPQYAQDHARFYKLGWFYLLKFTAGRIVEKDTELMVTAASVKTGKAQRAFTDAVNDAVQQTIPRNQWTTNFCAAGCDPCLQIADYCTWAIQRKWESKNQTDVKSYHLIKDKIYYERDFWAHGSKHYY
jgi:hypothetical protein